MSSSNDTIPQETDGDLGYTGGLAGTNIIFVVATGLMGIWILSTTIIFANLARKSEDIQKTFPLLSIIQGVCTLFITSIFLLQIPYNNNLPGFVIFWVPAIFVSLWIFCVSGKAQRFYFLYTHQKKQTKFVSRMLATNFFYQGGNVTKSSGSISAASFDGDMAAAPLRFQDVNSQVAQKNPDPAARKKVLFMIMGVMILFFSVALSLQFTFPDPVRLFPDVAVGVKRTRNLLTIHLLPTYALAGIFFFIIAPTFLFLLRNADDANGVRIDLYYTLSTAIPLMLIWCLFTFVGSVPAISKARAILPPQYFIISIFLLGHILSVFLPIVRYHRRQKAAVILRQQWDEDQRRGEHGYVKPSSYRPYGNTVNGGGKGKRDEYEMGNVARTGSGKFSGRKGDVAITIPSHNGSTGTPPLSTPTEVNGQNNLPAPSMHIVMNPILPTADDGRRQLVKEKLGGQPLKWTRRDFDFVLGDDLLCGEFTLFCTMDYSPDPIVFHGILFYYRNAWIEAQNNGIVQETEFHLSPNTLKLFRDLISRPHTFEEASIAATNLQKIADGFEWVMVQQSAIIYEYFRLTDPMAKLRHVLSEELRRELFETLMRGEFRSDLFDDAALQNAKYMREILFPKFIDWFNRRYKLNNNQGYF
ncbi:hypothetical protein HDU97_007395 [Phlyctochytrium planicorne]|nr:hypothetical protein HDU97_007395 [Phlyctochytrium planicorne]